MQSQCSTVPFKCPESYSSKTLFTLFCLLACLLWVKEALPTYFPMGTRVIFLCKESKLTQTFWWFPQPLISYPSVELLYYQRVVKDRYVMAAINPSKCFDYPKSYYRKLESRRRKEGMHLCSYNKENRAITSTLLCLLLRLRRLLNERASICNISFFVVNVIYLCWKAASALERVVRYKRAPQGPLRKES